MAGLRCCFPPCSKGKPLFVNKKTKNKFKKKEKKKKRKKKKMKDASISLLGSKLILPSMDTESLTVADYLKG
jgi:hypothetical protein